jgi:hypothetical protein
MHLKSAGGRQCSIYALANDEPAAKALHYVIPLAYPSNWPFSVTTKGANSYYDG